MNEYLNTYSLFEQLVKILHLLNGPKTWVGRKYNLYPINGFEFFFLSLDKWCGLRVNEK